MAKYQKFPPKADSWASFRRLDLVRFLELNHGYIVDEKSSSYKNNGNLLPIIGNKTQIEMYIPSALQEGKKDSFIIVRKQLNGEFFYTCPNGNAGEGSIIDFLATKYGLHPKTEGGKIAKLITDFDVTLSTLDLPKYVAPPPITVRDRNAIIAKFYKILKEFNSPDYLMARGLSLATINAPEFHKRIFNSLYKDRETGELITNTLFPLVDKEDSLRGIQYKNYKGGGLFKDSDRLLWKSNVTSKDGKVKELVIGEAEFDLLSYAELNDKIGKDILFISHSGSLYDLQIDAIQHLINQHQPEFITLATDRDQAGCRFDTDFIGQLINPNGQPIENDLKAKNSMYNNQTVVLTIDLSFESILQGKTRVNDLLNRFKSFNSPDDIIYNFKENAVSYGKNSAKIVIEYPNKEVHITNAHQIILRERKLENFIKIHKPSGADLKGEKIKDWNQKLMTIKKIKRDDVKNLMDKIKLGGDTDKIMLENAFVPKDLVTTFIREWNSEMLQPINDALQAGVSELIVSNLVSKGQLASLDKYIETVSRNLPDVNLEMDDFIAYRTVLSDSIISTDNQVRLLNEQLAAKDKELGIVKNTLNFEGDLLTAEVFQEKVDQQNLLTKEFNALRKQTGTFNEFNDGLKLKEIELATNKMSNKMWERIVRTQLNLPLRQDKISENKILDNPNQLKL